MENTQVANMLDEIADLLELQDDNPFRIRSYRQAARSVRSLSNRLEDLIEADKDLSEINNIGTSLADKIHEIQKSGTCKTLESLRKKIPAGLLEIMHIPGLGPKRTRTISDALNISSVSDLKAACNAHKVRELKGFGEKTENKILKGIGTLKRTAGRIAYNEAAEHLSSLRAHLDDGGELEQWEVAGSFRRGCATIGDLDILVRAHDRNKAADAILTYPAITEVINRGNERISVRLSGGPQVDFRFFDAAAFGAAFLYFTGSKAHNISVRRLAQEKKWKLNEYGLFKGKRRLAGKTEAAVYKRLNMNWIPPEMREDNGEVEASLNGDLPDLVTLADIRGDLQCHTTASDGHNTIKEMAEAARERGYDFLAITDHSKRVTVANGLNDDRAKRHADAIRKVNANMKEFWLMAGIEVDILKTGQLDLKEKTLEKMDWVVASIHYDRHMSRKQMTDRIIAALESGYVNCLGHPLGRIIGQREPIDVELDRIIEACVERNVALEINCQPERLDLPEHYCRDARDAGVTFTLGTDAHSTDGLHYMPLGVNVARRGWLRKTDILNTKTINGLRKWLG